MTSSEVERYETIDKKLNKNLKAEFEKGNINTSIASEVARLDESKQEVATEVIKEAIEEGTKLTKNYVLDKVKEVEEVEVPNLGTKEPIEVNIKIQDEEMEEWEKDQTKIVIDDENNVKYTTVREELTNLSNEVVEDIEKANTDDDFNIYKQATDFFNDKINVNNYNMKISHNVDVRAELERQNSFYDLAIELIEKTMSEK